jgi:hypothetical protein
MALYAIAREGATPVAGNVLLALTTGLEEICRWGQITVQGEASTSTVNRMVVRRSTTNGTTPTAQTPSKLSPTSPAAYTSAATTVSGEPTTAALPGIWTRAFNAFGGIIQWTAAPGQELWNMGATAGSNESSLESSSGTGLISAEVVFEEI